MMFRKLKKFNKFIQELAKENQKLYGSERMDCCELNKTKTKGSIKWYFIITL